MNTLMKYILVVLDNMKGQVLHQILSIVEIIIHTLTVFQIEILYWVVVKISQRKQYLKNKLKIHHLKQIDFIFLHTYQNDQIMSSYSVKAARNVAIETH